MKWLCTFTLALLLAGGFTAKADVPVFGNTTNGGYAFRLGGFGGLGEAGGGWVGFTPLENLDVTSVTIWLSGYTAQVAPPPGGGLYNGYASLYLNYSNQFGQFDPEALTGFAQPAPNDGSSAPFTYTVPSGSVILDAGQEYWLFVEGAAVNYTTYWLNGGTYTGDAVYDGSLGYDPAGYYPSTAIPAFTINTVPEPGVMGFVSLATLFGIGRVVGKRIQNRT